MINFQANKTKMFGQSIIFPKNLNMPFFFCNELILSCNELILSNKRFKVILPLAMEHSVVNPRHCIVCEVILYHILCVDMKSL